MLKCIYYFLNRHCALKAKAKIFYFLFIHNPFGKSGYPKVHRGRCNICGCKTSFWDFSADAETLICFYCGSSARNRAVAELILQELGHSGANIREFRDDSIRGYIASGYSILAQILKKKKFIISEYFDNVTLGKYKDGIRCEDLTRLTFSDETFDIVISEHVLEHVGDPYRSFIEVNRVLKKGGRYIFTIPFEAEEGTVRRVLCDGTTLMPKQFHIDPLRPQGSLVYTQFSKKDLIDKFLSPNKFKAEIVTVNDKNAGIFNCEVIKARKL